MEDQVPLDPVKARMDAARVTRDFREKIQMAALFACGACGGKKLKKDFGTSILYAPHARVYKDMGSRIVVRVQVCADCARLPEGALDERIHSYCAPRGYQI